MSGSETWVAAISKLLRLTQEGRLAWKSVSPEFLPPDEEAEFAYVTEHLGKRIRIYEVRRKVPVRRGYATGVFENSEWDRAVKLEFVDESDRPLYSPGYVEGLADLLDAVRYKTTNIDGFLEKLASE